MSFSDRLVLLRKEHNLTQKQLAAEMHISELAIQHYESQRRKPAFDFLISLADYFDVSLDYLVGRSDDPVLHSPSPRCKMVGKGGDNVYTVEMDLKSKEMLSAVLLWNQSIEWKNLSDLEMDIVKRRINDVYSRLNLPTPQFTPKDVEIMLSCLDHSISHLLRISDEEYLSERIPHCKNREHCISSLRKAQNHFAALLDHLQ